jgi:serine/threonine-protein kinase
VPLVLVLLALALLAPIAWAAGLFDSPQQEQPSAPQQVAVPDLVGMKLDEARDTYGDDFEIVEDGSEDSEQPVGTILEQDPSGGRAERGSELAVVVSGTRVADVPDVEGEERDDATSALEDAGFEVAVEEEESSEEEAGLVLDQDPGGGSTEEYGSEVRITVGTGPATVEVPDIPYGYTASEARALLEDAGLTLGGQSRAHNNDIPEGGVIDQSPRPGEEVEEGSAVDIVLSSGPEQVSVPNVVGQDVDTARQAMLDAGLGYDSREVESNEPAGTVVSTDPAGGGSVDLGTFVLISYSLGPPDPEPTPEPEPEPTPERTPAPDPTQGRDTQPRAEPRRDGGDAAADLREEARQAREDAREGQEDAREERGED